MIWFRQSRLPAIALGLFGLVAAKSADASPLDGLVGLWRFDENRGVTAFDSSGHGHDGSLQGVVSLAAPQFCLDPGGALPLPSSNVRGTLHDRCPSLLTSAEVRTEAGKSR